MNPCNIDITKTPNNEYEVRATFGKWSIGSNICHQRESDAILNLSKDIDKIVVRLFHTLHEWGDEYLKNKWDELNRNA